MNKSLLVFAFATVASLAACENNEKSETVVIERETTVREVEKDEPKGNSFSISVDEEGSAVDIKVEGK